MSQDIARQETGLSPLQALVQRVGGEDFQKQVALALPDHVKPERFARIAITALRTNPDLAQCEPDSVFNALLRCAQEGLLPDGYEAAIVKRGNKAVYQNMIGGLRKIAAEHGWTLRTFAVWAADEFEEFDVLSVPRHRPARPGVDRGELVAAWAVATHRDGRREFRVMHADEIAERRAVATTQNVWNKWLGPMAEKTVGRDLFFDLPLADIDRERIIGLLADDIEPGDAAEKLYGPTVARPALPAAAPQSQPVEAATAEGAVTDGQQAAAERQTAPPAAAPDPEPEPEPESEAEGSVFAAPAEIENDPTVLAANVAAMVVPPNGVHKEAGRNLAEIQALGNDGLRWFGMALRKTDLPPQFAEALFNYTRIFLPELYQQVLAEKESQAA